jgi:1,4-dihydroxy-2-naphthoyl-CoA synthase
MGDSEKIAWSLAKERKDLHIRCNARAGSYVLSDVFLRFALEGSIARLTLDRPEKGNAIGLDVARALLAAAIRCDTDPDIRCVVLTGAGRLFCAGGDIDLFASAGDGAAALLSDLAGTLHMAISRLSRMRKPLLVLVNGPAALASGTDASGNHSRDSRASHIRPTSLPRNFRGQRLVS